MTSTTYALKDASHLSRRQLVLHLSCPCEGDSFEYLAARCNFKIQLHATKTLPFTLTLADGNGLTPQGEPARYINTWDPNQTNLLRTTTKVFEIAKSIKDLDRELSGFTEYLTCRRDSNTKLRCEE